MIPLRLALRNFMCYRENVPPLSFEGVHLACLCGDNGNGKSALLDALTWALWGKARGKSDDELIHLGQMDMEVEFDFACGGEHYRILRKRSKGRPGRSGQTVLELQVATADGFKGISDNTLTATQNRIQHIIGMDYATFINSAYLRQGHADEFTVKQPWERKKVLADILGLSFYDNLEARAKEQAKDCSRRAGEVQNAIAEIEREIGKSAEYRAELSQVESALGDLQKKSAQAEAELVKLRGAKRELDLKREQLEDLRRAVARERQGLEQWRRAAAEARSGVASYQALQNDGSNIEKGYAELCSTRERAENLNSVMVELFSLTERKGSVEKAIAAARGELAARLRHLQTSLGDLDGRLQRLPALKMQREEACLALADLDKEDSALEQDRQRLQELGLQIQHHRTMNQRLTDEVKELREKLVLLQEGETACPLCGADLGAAGKQRIEQSYRADISTKSNAMQGNGAALTACSSQYQELAKGIQQREGHLKRERAAGQSRVTALESGISEAERALPERERMAQDLADCNDRLKNDGYAEAERGVLLDLTQQEKALGYDKEEHRRVRERLAELERYRELHRRLAEAHEKLPDAEAALARANEAIAGGEAALAADTAKADALAADIAGLPGLAQRLATAEQGYAAGQQELAGLQAKAGAVRERLQRCAALEKERELKGKELQAALIEAETYEELSRAFGKRGIQAFIIESVIPELEAEANDLLARMTDNRMHVKIETQRGTRKGETVETLDIRIADEIGTRDYEMYSGGEAFRINFALRIALSRLLARRAGAPLSTLVIDEGFGTQDSSGLAKLVGAINAIQEDFDKIIVITHLDELKEAFPVRIDVVKTAAGSTLAVN